MSTTAKQSVLILGPNGFTGVSIVDGLLASGKYHVMAGIRPASLNKPEVTKLRERGVEIRTVDVALDDTSKLEAAFQGVDTLICSFHYTEIDSQFKIADAAKLAGVKRFVPNDWGTACVRGLRKLYDQKVRVHDYVKFIDLGHTFIDVGYWMVLLLPVEPERSDFPGFNLNFLPCNSHVIYGTGDVKTAVTNRSDIGRFVAEIIGDERTLNQYVFCWGDEKSQNEMWDIARKVKAEVGGGELAISPKQVISEEELQEILKSTDQMMVVGNEYMQSMFIRGDNTVENAKKPEYGGALDARELYPNLKVSTLEEYAKQVYTK